jgi:hypothetical protein
VVATGVQATQPTNQFSQAAAAGEADLSPFESNAIARATNACARNPTDCILPIAVFPAGPFSFQHTALRPSNFPSTYGDYISQTPEQKACLLGFYGFDVKGGSAFQQDSILRMYLGLPFLTSLRADP